MKPKTLEVIRNWKRGPRFGNPTAWLIVIMFAVIYSLLFPWLWRNFGPLCRIFSLSFVLLAAWFWGLRGGVLAALLNLLLNIALHKSIGAEISGGPLGFIVAVSIGAITGRLRDLSLGLKEQLHVREQTEEQLERYRDRLEGMVEKRTSELMEANIQLQKQIAERRQAEVALRESEVRFRNLAELLPETIYEMDEMGNLTFVNQKAFGHFMYTQEDFDRGLKAFDMLVPEDRERARENARKIGKGEHLGLTEYTALRKDGSTFPAMFHSTPIIREGKPAGLRGFIIDITGLKKAEEAVRQSEEKYRTLVEESFDGIFVQKGSKIVLTNQRLDEMLGYENGELLGIDHWLIYHPDYQQLTRTRARARMRGEEIISNYEVKLQRKDGSTLHGEIRTRVISFEGETGIQVWIRDITERKKAEETLRESEARYRMVVEHATDIIYRTDANGYFTFCNPIAMRILGYSQEELTGKHYLGLVHPDFRKKAERFYGIQLVKKTPNTYYEVPVVTKDGKEIWMGQNVQLIMEGDRIDGFQALARDITDRVQAETALKNSEEEYRSVFENTGTATVIIEEDSTITMANAEFAKLSGFTKDELEGKRKWTEFIAKEDLEKIKEYHAERREEGEKAPKEYEFHFIDKQGRVKDILNKVEMIPGTKRSVASLMDISSRKRSEEDLEREKEKFRVLVEESPLGVSLISEEGHFRYINPRFIELFGYTLEDIPTGKKWFEKAYPDPEYRHWVIATWKEDFGKLKTGESQHQQFHVTCKNGMEKEVSFRAMTLESGDYFVISEDITEQKHLEAQLRQSQKMEAVGTLAGGIAHDFNNLLQAIMGYTQILLMDRQKDGSDPGRLQEIEKAARRASELTRQLLTFSRKVESKLRPVDLNQEVLQVQKLLKRTIPRMISIELHLQERLKVINADPAQIEQVLMNLGVNARDAMPEGGKLDIETANVTLDEEYCKKHLGAVPGDYVLLSLSDTGHGMDKKTLEHIFEPFYTTKGTGRGTGLGLSMVFGIVKSHGGYITCHSEPGEGSTFKIYFPAIEAGPVEEGARGEEDEALSGGQETLLLVDDEGVLLDLGKNMLERFGYTVLTADRGESAIEIYKEKREMISLIILDLIMPGIGGKKCLEELLKVNPRAKVVIASGYSVDGPTGEALRARAKGFISKPYELSQMLKAVRQILDQE